MPKSKDALSRYKIIDEELSRYKLVKTKVLARLCSDRLGKPVSGRLIQKDIDDMKNDTALGFNAPIKYDNKEKAHYYEIGTTPIFSLRIDLTDEEIIALLFYVKASSHYKEYKIFDEITDAIKKVLDAANISEDLRHAFQTDAILETEKILPLKGSELIYKLIVALRERKVIEFDYKRFEDNKWKRRTLKPLLLKEASQMWYVLGMVDGRSLPVIFAIDRMKDVRTLDVKFDPIEFNFKEHFKHSLGITVADLAPVKVVLRFTSQQGNYVKALKIHESQKIEKDTKTTLTVSLVVRPTYELYAKILSYGDDVTVVSPKSIRDEVRKRLRKTVKNY